MFGWAYLWLGVLVATLQQVEGDTVLLSDVLKNELLIPYNQCQAVVLNGGFLTLGDEMNNNYTVNYPSLFITCENSSEPFENDSMILRQMATTLSAPSVKYDVDSLLAKDNFEDSILIIAFASCAVCIGTWMVYLVLMLLPSESRLSRSLLVPFYVLFSAFYDTAMLVRTVQTIFEVQYRDDVQDFCAYERQIIKGTAYRVGSTICNVLLYINWTMIIYYMFHDKRKITAGWLRPLFTSRNKLIIVAGITLTVIDTVLYIVLNSYHKTSLRIAVTVVDFIIYTLFCGLTYFFVWHDFRFILAPHRMHLTNGNQFKNILLLIWNDYHETIPLLIYNIALFGLLFFTKVYFTIDYSSDHKWKFKIVKFLQLIITVSVWGLISVLEKRELILSKQTVLGRKINDNNEYFFDPKLSSRQRNTVLDEDKNISKSAYAETIGGSASSEENNRNISLFKKPIKIWRSEMERPKNLRKLGRTGGRRFLNAFIGLNHNDTCGKDTNVNNMRHGPEVGHSSSGGLSESIGSNSMIIPVDEVYEPEPANNEEIASVETELARNYIYDYDNND